MKKLFIILLLLVLLIPAISLAQETGEVKLGDVIIMRFHSPQVSNPQVLAENVQQRIQKALTLKIPNEQITVEKASDGYLIKWGNIALITVTREIANSNSSEPLDLAKKWAWKLKKTAKDQIFGIYPSSLTLGVGETKKIELRGNLGGGEMKINYYMSQIQVERDLANNVLLVRGVSAGKSEIIIEKDGLTQKIQVICRSWAGKIPGVTEIEVSGNPVPTDILESAALQAATAQCEINPGAQIYLRGPIEIFDSSVHQKELIAKVPLAIDGTDYLRAEGTTEVILKNRDFSPSPSKILMLSNRPEGLKENGTLLSGELVIGKPIRLLVSHKNESPEERLLWVTLTNPSDQPAQLFITPSLSGPSYQELEVGHKAVFRFLRNTTSSCGYFMELKPKESKDIVAFWLPPKQIAAAFLNLQQISGQPLKIHIATTLTKLPYVPQKIISEDFDPFKVHPHGIFPEPEILLKQKITLGGKTPTFVVGNPPFLLDEQTGQPNLGNYGVTYNFEVTLENQESQEKTVKFYFLPVGGGAYGSIAFDQEIIQVPLSKSFEERLIKTIKVAPNSFKVIHLATIPEPGSYYPVKIMLREENSNVTTNN